MLKRWNSKKIFKINIDQREKNDDSANKTNVKNIRFTSLNYENDFFTSKLVSP